MSDQVKSKIKFIHCRNVDSWGMTLPKGGLTVSYILNENFKVVGWAAAKCAIHDVYNKTIGRMKAQGRLKSAQYYQDCPEIDESIFIKQTQEGFKKTFAWNKK